MQLITTFFVLPHAVVDPDFELRGEPGFDLLTLLVFLPSVISSFFTQNNEGARAPWTPPLDLPLTFLSISKFANNTLYPNFFSTV